MPWRVAGDATLASSTAGVLEVSGLKITGKIAGSTSLTATSALFKLVSPAVNVTVE